jgi:hypothetical protein
MCHSNPHQGIPSTTITAPTWPRLEYESTIPRGADEGLDLWEALVREDGWSPGQVWTGVENLAPTGIRSPDFLVHSELLYYLRYPGPILYWVPAVISCKFCIEVWYFQPVLFIDHPPLVEELHSTSISSFLSIIWSWKSDLVCENTDQEPISHCVNGKNYNVLRQP